MFSNKKGCRLFHCSHIQLIETVPGILSVKNTGNIANGNTIEIFLSFGIVPAVETFRHIVHTIDRNIPGKISIQIILHLPAFHIAVGMEIRHLLISMDAGICSSCSDQFYLFSCHLAENIFQFSLDGHAMTFAKALPSIISAAIIFNQQPYISLHMLSFHISQGADAPAYRYLSMSAPHSDNSHLHSDSGRKTDIRRLHPLFPVIFHSL